MVSCSWLYNTFTRVSNRKKVLLLLVIYLTDRLRNNNPGLPRLYMQQATGYAVTNIRVTQPRKVMITMRKMVSSDLITIIIIMIIIIIIMIVYFPKNYRLMHILHTRKSYVNIVYKCNSRDGCQRNRNFIIAGHHIEFTSSWKHYICTVRKSQQSTFNRAQQVTSFLPSDVIWIWSWRRNSPAARSCHKLTAKPGNKTVTTMSGSKLCLTCVLTRFEQ